VAITRGLLKSATPEEIQGVLAHEVGHWIHGDTKISIIVQVVNTIGNVATAILTAILIFISTLASATGERQGVAFSIVVGLFALLLKAFLTLFQLLIRIGYFAVGRQEEFLADSFAKDIGFANGLVSFLRKIETPRKLQLVSGMLCKVPIHPQRSALKSFSTEITSLKRRTRNSVRNFLKCK